MSHEAALDAAERLIGRFLTERRVLDEIRLYRKGRQPFPLRVPVDAPREVHAIAKASRINICALPVESIGQSLFVDGFRTDVSEADDPADPLWQVWQQNKMDAWQSASHVPPVTYGAGYTVVWPGVRGLDSIPVIRPVSPRSMVAEYTTDDPDWPLLALEKTGQDQYTLYDEEARYHVGLNDRKRRVVTGVDEHTMGVTPVVRFRDEIDLDADDDVLSASRHDYEPCGGQVAPLRPLQDQIDLTTFCLLLAQHYGAHRQRYIIGWMAASDAERRKMGSSVLWEFADHPDDIEVGAVDPTPLDGYIESREATLRHAAALSQTPVHELTAKLIQMSEDALAAAEASKDRKVDTRKTLFGESHEQVFWLVGRQIGVEVPADAQVVWRDTSARSFQATVDALTKLKSVGVPIEMLLPMIPNWTKQDVERSITLIEQATPLEFFTEVLERQMADGAN